jgi:N-formylglutamate deformylase/formiminoglutamase
METFRFTPGSGPVLVSLPHIGTLVPPEIRARLSPAADGLPDTDWHLDRLYDFLGSLGVGILQATLSRYVIDLNRPPDDKPLYAGATTGLCPDTLFDGTPLYRDGAAPDRAEITARREVYWRPYHDHLAGELANLKARHGFAVLFDAHSIRSVVPRLFEGRLPDFNMGTATGASLDPDLARRLAAGLADAPVYTSIVDGRFKGGHITRHYGRPGEGIQAVQLELAQSTYMDEAPPFTFRPDLAKGVRPHLRRFVETLVTWAAEQSHRKT